MWQSMMGLAGGLDFGVLAHPHHEVHTHAFGFEAGFLHPLLGVDHLLAMIAVGVLAARTGGRALWMLPTSFLACMVVGGYAGLAGFHIPGVEIGIALSVVLLGMALMGRHSLPLTLMLVACGAFGFVHGAAHGVEMPSLAQPALYATGFLLATAMLHGTGVVLGRFATHNSFRQRALQLAGAAMAFVGVALLVAR